MAPDDARPFTRLRDDDSPVPPLPPSNTEAEQALLGAILINNAAYGRVSEFLGPEHFANAVHRRIFAAMGTLIERGEIANPVSLKNLFDQDGALTEIGGSQYLARLAESAVTIINAEHYGRTIHDLHLRRELITIGQDVVTEAFRHDLDNPAVTQIERAEQKLYLLASLGQSEGGPKPAIAAMDAALVTINRGYKGEITGLPTGLTDLDKRLGGLYPGDLIIVGGATSMGKTALSTDVADFNARHGLVILFAELEMTSEQLGQRFFAKRTGISVERQRKAHELTQHDIDRLVEARSEYQDLQLHIDDSVRSVAQVHSRARRLKRRIGLDLIIVDYLQLLHTDRRPENRVQEVSIISQGLKAIAKELAVPVLALSQLSREVSKRDDKRPHLHDLRDSGSLEHDADAVIFTYREAYYLERDEPRQRANESEAQFSDRFAKWSERLEATRGLAELIIAKNRHGGAPHTVTMHFDGERASFDNHTSRSRGENG